MIENAWKYNAYIIIIEKKGKLVDNIKLENRGVGKGRMDGLCEVPTE